MSKPHDDTIRFEESGAAFEIFGPAADGTRMVAVTDVSGELHGHEARSFEDACRYVDEWIGKHVPADDPGRFPGLRFLAWDHETRCVSERSINSRGRFLEFFDDGTSHTDVQALRNWREATGDVLLEIRDGSGALLLDNRVAARRTFEAWNRRHADLDMDALDETMSGIESDGPMPGRT